MRKGVDVAPTLDNTSDEARAAAREHLDLTTPRTGAPETQGARPLSLTRT